MKIEVPFLDEIPGLGIIKLLGLNTYGTLTMKVKFKRNEAFLELTKLKCNICATIFLSKTERSVLNH